VLHFKQKSSPSTVRLHMMVWIYSKTVVRIAQSAVWKRRTSLRERSGYSSRLKVVRPTLIIQPLERKVCPMEVSKCIKHWRYFTTFNITGGLKRPLVHILVYPYRKERSPYTTPERLRPGAWSLKTRPAALLLTRIALWPPRTRSPVSTLVSFSLRPLK